MPLADSIFAIATAAMLSTVAQAQTAACSEAATPIPDGSSSANVVISIPADLGATIEVVTVSIDLTHEWLGDLTITVSHAGQTAVLIDRIGTSTWTFGCGGDNIAATFTDAAVIDSDDLCIPDGPTPMLFGEILPAEALSTFNGLPVDGDWTVTVTDNNPIDAGVINTICIHVVVAPGECVGDVTGDGAVDLTDLNLVLANFGQATADGDADGNGDVDLADLNIVLANFGGNC